MSKKNEVENEVKVGDKVMMNQDYLEEKVCKGEIGKVKKLPTPGSLLYKVKFKGRKSLVMYGYRFDLLPYARKNATVPATAAVSPEPIKDIPAKKEPIKKGIRIKVREVKPDVFEIVDFTALKADDLPEEYTMEHPCVSVARDGALVVSLPSGNDTWIRQGDRLTREKCEDIIETCKAAGKRLRKINTFPKEPFEVVI